MEDPPPEASRLSPLEVDPELFRAAGRDLVDHIADLLATIRDRKVTAGLSAGEIREILDSSAGVPEEGCDFQSLVSQTSSLLSNYSLYNGHPKFLGYVTSSPAPIGMLADFLAAAVNPNVGAWALSPVATEIEEQAIRWIAELLAYPGDCSGVLVSGGNEANYVGLYTALRSAFPRHDKKENPESLLKVKVYASIETHTWLEKALDMFGFPAGALRSIQVDADGRLLMQDLEASVKNDLEGRHTPLAVIGSAGTVSTGAVDPLFEMARLCKKYGAWFHVDGAYGGFAAMTDEAPDDIRGLSEADSLAIDPHKWLYAPLDAGCALVRDREKHRAAFSYHPPYYHFGEEVTNFVDYSPQNSRSFRALKVWMALKQVGRSGYERMISDDIALARQLYETLDANEEFQVFTQHLSITTFRWVPQDCHPHLGEEETENYLNQLNETLQEKLEISGELFVSNAVINDTYLLRACIVNFRTTERDVTEIPQIIARTGQKVHDRLSSQRA